MELFGLYAEEIDTLYPKERNGVCFTKDSPIQGTYSVRDYCELIQVQDAQVLAEYTEDFYKGTPAVTVKENGEGKAYYVAARAEDDCMEHILQQIWEEKQIPLQKLPAGVEYHKRENEAYSYEFYINYTKEMQTISRETKGIDCLTGDVVEGEHQMEPMSSLIIKCEK